MKKWDSAWRSLRHKAGLDGLRFHDLRHTFLTQMAEAGVPEDVRKSIAGHLTKRMLDHYTHIGMAAKRRALESVAEQREKELESSNPAPVVDEKAQRNDPTEPMKKWDSAWRADDRSHQHR
jgi:intergrase/recombinase